MPDVNHTPAELTRLAEALGMTTCTCVYSNYPGGYSMDNRDPKCPVHGDRKENVGAQ